ncbi:phage GP46 family protein [uncultured Hyphomicrobium sp.]|uniref:phage GP46 family protein n=1 Tax=uncultured Hyphomicrobium sp. TaxID=194373 RepID=UPI0025D2DDA8|nr:phage GP46 family protein [uncultured Hyphomicrobium sp.]
MSWRIRIRDKEECAPQPFLSPDLLINVADYGVYLDFAIAEKTEIGNRGGLRSKEALHTAILIQLFTDARARDNDPTLDPLDPDRRGWWGDSIAPADEQQDYPLGSRLWLLRRALLNEETAQIANEMVVECLQPILNQGVVARFEVETEASYARVSGYGPETGVLLIGIKGYSQHGAVAYDQKFDVLWQQIASLSGQQYRGAA